MQHGEPYRLFLDDVREPSTSGWTIVRTFEGFCNAIIGYGCPYHIAFDHDLGTNQPTGMDCAKWFIEWVLDDKSRLPENFRFTVHSMNPPGAANINGLMKSFLEHMANGNYGAIRQQLKE